MPIQKKENIKVEVIQNVDVLKEIHNILIDTEGLAYWDVWTWSIKNSNRERVVTKDYYCIDFTELVILERGKYNVIDIEGTLWVKTDYIDKLPETTQDQRKIKEKFKKKFSFVIS